MDKTKKQNAFSLVNELLNNKEKVKIYNIGMVGEEVITRAYRKLSVKELENIRILINHIIKEKKIYINNQK